MRTPERQSRIDGNAAATTVHDFCLGVQEWESEIIPLDDNAGF